MKTKILNSDEWLYALTSNDSDLRITSFGHHRSFQSKQVGPRVIADHHVSFYIKGRYCNTIAGNDYIQTPLSLLWVQPGVEQTFTPVGEAPVTSSYWLRFFFGKGDTSYTLDQDCLYASKLQGIPGMFNDIFPLISLHHQNLSFRLRCLLGNVLSYVLEEVHGEVGAAKRGLSNAQTKAAFKIINNTLGERLTVAEIAEQLEMNPDYFSRQFKKSSGMSVQGYVKQERIKLAKHIMLESHRTLSEIAYYLGYKDIFLFSRQFKEVVGQSPKKWRAAQGFFATS